MRRMTPIACVLCLVAVGGVFLATHAGPLDPPAGPVAPSYKTLSEVEPRIAISPTNTPGDATSLFKITQPGSYYLAGNVTGVAGKRGILVASSEVTIDLCGFTMLGVGGSLEAISCEYVISTAVRNGQIYGWGSDGVRVYGNGATIEDVKIDFCGGWGINFNASYPGSAVRRCIVGQCALGGINAAQVSKIEQCTAYYMPAVPGIVVQGGSQASGCVVWNCNPGIQAAGTGSTVTDCATYLCPVGILAAGNDARIERNTVRTSPGQIGYRASASGNCFFDNQANGLGDKYDFAAGNRLRLLISQLPESIDWPAEVRLAGTLTGTSASPGIIIAADDVTLDLSGHALVGVPGSQDGIVVNGSRRNVSVRNGSLRAWGGDGVDLANASSSLVESVRASDNTGAGIRTGERSMVRTCETRSNGSDNIVVGGFSQVADCIADASTGGHGINASFVQSHVRNCSASGNALSGIHASQRTLVQNCLASNNTLHGVHATFAGTVEGCFINANGGDGVRMDAGGAVAIRNNTISESSGTGDAGIRVTSAGSCHIEGNTVVLCATGISVSTAGNIVVRNSAMNNGTNFSIVGGNTAGPVINPAGAAAATNPLANYSN